MNVSIDLHLEKLFPMSKDRVNYTYICFVLMVY